MRRWAFNVIAGLSLLLCAATILLWARSRWVADHFWLIYRDGGGDLLRASRGDLVIYCVFSNEASIKGRWKFEYKAGKPKNAHPRPNSYPVYWHWGPFSYSGTRRPPSLTTQALQNAATAIQAWEVAQKVPSIDKSRLERLEMYAAMAREVQAARWSYHRAIVFPAWLLVVLTALTPIVWILVKLRERRTQRIGQVVCTVCGYDLRATPDKCPECGTVAGSSESHPWGMKSLQ